MISIRVKNLDDDQQLKDHFNSGDFARTNYKRLYHLQFTSGETRHEVKTPSLRQVAYSWWLLRKPTTGEGTPYDRHNHPVMMLNFNVRESTFAKAKVLAERQKRLYSKKHKPKRTKRK